MYAVVRHRIHEDVRIAIVHEDSPSAVHEREPLVAEHLGFLWPRHVKDQQAPAVQRVCDVIDHRHIDHDAAKHGRTVHFARVSGVRRVHDDHLRPDADDSVVTLECNGACRSPGLADVRDVCLGTGGHANPTGDRGSLPQSSCRPCIGRGRSTDCSGADAESH